MKVWTLAQAILRRLCPAQPPLAERIERFEAEALKLPQMQLPVTHHFAPGCYGRELFMPAGSFVIGHEHKTRHFNVMLTGRMRVWLDGVAKELVAPCVLVSEAGTRKAAYILEDVRWVTFHPTHETNVDKLEDELIIKSAAFQNYEQEFAALAAATKEKKLCHLPQ